MHLKLLLKYNNETYLDLIASTGLSLEAKIAGSIPEITPINNDINPADKIFLNDKIKFKSK